jgi:hypothetical protein
MSSYGAFLGDEFFCYVSIVYRRVNGCVVELLSQGIRRLVSFLDQLYLAGGYCNMHNTRLCASLDAKTRASFPLKSNQKNG